MKTFLTMLLLGALMAVGGGTAAVAADSPDPVIGTWTLNLAKSKFTPGPAPQSGTRTYAMSGDSVSLTYSMVGADGKTVSGASTFKYDGKDYPITGSPDYDGLALKRVNGSTINSTMKMAGKVVGSTVRSVSGHGKVLTLTSKYKNAAGKRVATTAVYDKQ